MADDPAYDDLRSEEVPEENGRPHRRWRGWHILGHFLPMVVLGLVLMLIGLTSWVPHRGAESYGVLFIWVGGILIVFAIIGMLFTKCPADYSTHWVRCVQERDVVHDPRMDRFHRELSVAEDQE